MNQADDAAHGGARPRHWSERVPTIGRIATDFVVTAGVLIAVSLPLAMRDSDIAFGSLIAWAVVFGSISVNAFALRGFYQQNRSFRPQRKVVAIGQAVLLTHLVLAFLLLMAWDFVDFPRASLLLTPVLTWLALSWLRLKAHKTPVLKSVVSVVDRSADPPKKVESVLVVGGAGYIGSGLLRRLLERGYRVRLLDMLMFGEGPIADMIDHPNLELMQADFRQVEHVVRAMSGMDAVVHLGAIVGDPACEIDHQLTVDTNLLATRMVAEVAKAAGVERMVFASTCSVYGAGDEILDERSALNPVSLYAKTKIACEEVLHQMADENFTPVILRFGTIYGLSGRTRFDLVVNLLTAKALVDGEITVFGGDQWRPFLHVDDASAAVLAALEAPLGKVAGEVFNVGSDGQNHTIEEVGRIINQMVPDAELLLSGTDGDRRDYRVDFSKIRNVLGFEPAWTVRMGIQQVIDAIRSGTVIDYADPVYSNVKSLRERHEVVIDLRREVVEAVSGGESGHTLNLNMSYGMPFDSAGSDGPWIRRVLVPDPAGSDQAAAG